MAFREWWSDFRGYWPIEPLPTSVGRNPDQWRHQRSVCMSNTTNHRQNNYGMDIKESLSSDISLKCSSLFTKFRLCFIAVVIL